MSPKRFVPSSRYFATHPNENCLVFNVIQITKTNLTFRGPCIVIYSYNESQRDALFLKFIWQSTLHVSDRSISINRIISKLYTRNRYLFHCP